MHHQRMWTSSLAVIPQTLSLPACVEWEEWWCKTLCPGWDTHTHRWGGFKDEGWGGVGGMGWGGLQLATRQCDSEVLKGLPDWTRSTSSHTHTHTF